jgi:hypothetical protein
MLKRSVAAVVLTLAAAATMVACAGDHIAGPANTPASAPAAAPTMKAPAGQSGNLLGGLTGLVGGVVNTVTSILPVDELLPVLHRRQSLRQDVTWSFVAGPDGATSHNSATGLTIVIPRGALTTTQTITVRAPAGSLIQYEFGPHGLQFAKPVELRQDLTLADLTVLLGLDKISGAYYGQGSLQYDPSTNLAHVDELEPTTVNLLTLSTSVKIQHFSGYILATGRGAR